MMLSTYEMLNQSKKNLVLWGTFNQLFTFHDGHEFSNERHSTCSQVLTESHFLEEDGDPAEDHGHEVGD